MRLTIPTRYAATYNVAPFLSLTRELNRILEPEVEPTPTFGPRLDLIEDANNLVVRLDLPGVAREHVQVSLVEDVLTIAGERKPDVLEKDTGYLHRERPYGRFERTVTIARPVDADKVTAQFKDGVLTVTLPKAAEAKPRQIDIQAN